MSVRENALTKWVVGAVLMGGLALLGFLAESAYGRILEDAKAAREQNAQQEEKNAQQDLQIAVVNTKLDQIIDTLSRIERRQYVEKSKTVDKTEKSR